MEKQNKENITNALQIIDAAISQYKGSRQEHELLTKSLRALVEVINDYFKEEPKQE